MQKPTPKVKKSSAESKRRILALHKKGLSLREIATQLKCSHMTVKRVLESVNGHAQPELFKGLEHGKKTRPQVIAEIRAFAKNARYDQLADVYLEPWIEEVFELLQLEKGLKRLGTLLARGPARPGRPLSSMESVAILRNENDWLSGPRSKIRVASAMGRNGVELERICGQREATMWPQLERRRRKPKRHKQD